MVPNSDLNFENNGHGGSMYIDGGMVWEWAHYNRNLYGENHSVRQWFSFYKS